MSSGTSASKRRFQLILIKPSHYDDDGYVVQWVRSTMPSNSLAAIYSLAKGAAERKLLGGHLPIDVTAMDETILGYARGGSHAASARMAVSAWWASLASSRMNFPAPSTSPAPYARPACKS